MLRFIGSLLALIISWGSWRAEAKTLTANCRSRALQYQDCQLKLDKQSFRMLAKRLVYEDGANLWTHDLPVHGESVEWHSLVVRRWGAQPLLEWKVWEAPKGPSSVQNLRWFVIRADQPEMRILVDQVVGRRRAQPEAKKKWIMDPMGRTRLWLKGDQLHWQAGTEHGQVPWTQTP